MWNSNGDIINGHMQVVDAGDMHVSGRIDDHSFVVLVSTGGSIIVDGKIDDHSFVVLVSPTGSITVGGKIDNNSNVTLKAAGNVTVGTTGNEGDDKIDGHSNVEVVAGGNITLGSKIDQSTVDFKAHGAISMAKIDQSMVRQLADHDISVQGKIDGTSRVELVSNRGSIRIDGKIDGESKVSLTAAQNIDIGHDSHLGDGDRKIDGNSFVSATAGGAITLGGGIYKDYTAVDFAAAGASAIGKDISGGASARLLSGSGQVTVQDGITDKASVISFPPGALNTKIDNATLTEQQWAASDVLMLNPPVNGHWWENWPQTFGYVVQSRIVPRSVDDLAAAVQTAPGTVKAVGGGWSFTDAALPLKTQADVDQASILLRGAPQRQDMRHVLEGVNDAYPKRMDLLPQAVGRNVAFSTSYDQANLRQVTTSGVQLPATKRVRLIETKSLASSLHCEFNGIRAILIPPPPAILFHVEAGITMADLQQLLDHQNPRLAIQASGGSPGATLAGVLSTATHGGEFGWPLLVDMVRAVHLVGPGGEQWWIEGNVRVADQVKLQKRYPKIDKAHFIGQGWNGIPGLSAQDVLKAVAVSMGTMGVIYSVVLEVVPQFGLRQVVHPMSWAELLAAAKTSEQALHAGNAAANQAVVNALIDGKVNGTGIPKVDNVYVDLAINPLNQDCWVVNRQVTPKLPDDANSPALGFGDFASALSVALSSNSVDIVQSSKALARVFDFLSYATDVPENADDVANDAAQAARLVSFITGLGDALSGTVAAANVQAILNALNHPGEPDRGLPFLGDALTGFFHALQDTALGRNSDRTGVSYKVGAIGWPDGGLPGRALEIALDATNAFTFVQKVLFDDVLAVIQIGLAVKPLIGYISIRLCPPTQTLMGMQQYAPLSVMIEVVAYRSPEANDIMDAIQAKALAFATSGPKPLLHWGLENDQVNHAFLVGTPLGKPYKGTTRLDAFKKIRKYLANGHAQVFDNNFSIRMGV